MSLGIVEFSNPVTVHASPGGRYRIEYAFVDDYGKVCHFRMVDPIEFELVEKQLSGRFHLFFKPSRRLVRFKMYCEDDAKEIDSNLFLVLRNVFLSPFKGGEDSEGEFLEVSYDHGWKPSISRLVLHRIATDIKRCFGFEQDNRT